MVKSIKSAVAGRIGTDDNKPASVVSRVINSKPLWEVEDEFSKARADRIVDIYGNPTNFAMVYGMKNTDGGTQQGVWMPVRPVSDRFRPIRTGDLVDMAVERINGDLMTDAEDRVVRTDRFGTSIQVSLRLNRPLELPGKPFDVDHPWTRHGQTSRANTSDLLYPVVNIRNAYDATSAITVDVGWFRMICSNGMKIMVAGMSSKAIHTKNEVIRVLDEVAKADFKGDEAVIRWMTIKTLSKSQIASICKLLPDKHAKELVEYVKQGNNTAWAMTNGLSFLQTHNYSLLRSRQLDKPIRLVQQMAMALAA